MGIFDKVKDALIETERSDNDILNNDGLSSINGEKVVSNFYRNGDGSKTPIFETTQETVVAEIDNSDLISIDDIYAENGLSNKDKSIYKVNEIKTALPDMPTDSKKASVIGMLTVSKIGISEIEDDAKERTDVIIAALNNFTSETQRIVDAAEEQINEKLKEIEDLKNRISNRKQLQEMQSKLCENELDLIASTVKFIV